MAQSSVGGSGANRSAPLKLPLDFLRQYIQSLTDIFRRQLLGLAGLRLLTFLAHIAAAALFIVAD